MIKDGTYILFSINSIDRYTGIFRSTVLGDDYESYGCSIDGRIVLELTVSLPDGTNKTYKNSSTVTISEIHIATREEYEAMVNLLAAEAAIKKQIKLLKKRQVEASNKVDQFWRSRPSVQDSYRQFIKRQISHGYMSEEVGQRVLQQFLSTVNI